METQARYLWIGIFALATIVAGFAFVYWLNNSSGLGGRAYYRISFENGVSGLQSGSVVRFNGVRVGEVVGVQLDKADPQHVTATIAVDRSTPLRADTAIGLDFQGLMGTPAVSLKGGTAAAAVLSGAQADPPLLVADPEAGRDVTQAARQALLRVDKILADNSESFKGTLDNLKTFTAALARNSDRVDKVMAGLERLASAGAGEKPKPVYDLMVPQTLPQASQPPKGQFTVAEPTAVVAFETQRMLARSKEGELSILGEAQWSDTLPKLLQAKIIQSLENAGFLSAVTGPIEKVATNYQLLLDLRNFAIVSDSRPMADIEFSAKIVADDGHIVGARLIHASAPAAGMDAPAVVAAFNQAFGKAVVELVAWAGGIV
jgi:phospholipid/cholesterol/gamma-HCH transport system substrate-binding protein